jgi:hypothetical protein
VSRRRRLTVALLAVATATLIALIVTSWSGSLLKGLGAVAAASAIVVVMAIFVWNGEFL